MAEKRQRGRPATSERDDVTVKIDRMLKVKADYVAASRRIPTAEYLSELMRPHVERDFDKAKS